jgi:hypothetical protein
VFAVTLSKDYYLPELEIYAGSKDRVYTDDKANNFLSDIAKLTNGGGSCPNIDTAPSTQAVPYVPPPAPTPVPTAAPTCGSLLDLMIILDSSGSVEAIFEQEKDLAIKVVQQIPDASFDTRVAVASTRFASTAYIELAFKTTHDKATIIRTLKEIHSEGGATSAVAGTKAAVQEMRNNLRPGARALVVLVSDGNSQDFPYSIVHEAAKALNDTGATVFAVTLSKDYYLPELEIYAGSKDRVYTDDKANNFLSDIAKLTNGGGSCPNIDAAPSTQTPVTPPPTAAPTPAPLATTEQPSSSAAPTTTAAAVTTPPTIPG